MKNLVLLALALCGSVSAGAQAAKTPSLSLIGSSVLYKQVASKDALPSQDLSLTISLDLKDLSAFKTSQSREFAQKISVLKGLFALFEEETKKVSALDGEKNSQILVKFDLAGRSQAFVSVFDFTKVGDNISAKITLYGLGVRAPAELSNLLNAVVGVRETSILKSLSKGLLGAGVVATAAVLWQKSNNLSVVVKPPIAPQESESDVDKVLALSPYLSLAAGGAGRETDCLGEPEDVAMSRVKRFADRMVGSKKKEDAELRNFVVVPNPEGNDFEKIAAVIINMASLSVASFKEHEAIGERAFKKFHSKPKSKRPEDPGLSYQLFEVVQKKMKEAILRELPVGSVCLRDTTSALVYSVPCADKQFVLKIQSPYSFYELRRRAMVSSAFRYANNSLKRHVRRVLVADFINKNLAEEYGFHAPEKKLCLRFGASLEGPMNDRFVVVVERFVGKPLAKDSSLELSAEQMLQIPLVMKKAASADFDDENVWKIPAPQGSRRQCDLMFVDCEAPFFLPGFTQYDFYNSSHSLGTVPQGELQRTQALKKQGERELLERKYVSYNEINTFLYDRVKMLCEDADLEAEQDVLLQPNAQCIFLRRKALRDYLKNYVEKSFLSVGQAAEITNFWMGEDLVNGFIRLDALLALIKCRGEDLIKDFFEDYKNCRKSYDIKDYGSGWKAYEAKMLAKEALGV